MLTSAGASAHRYAARLIWDGNAGAGTSSYAAYGRGYRILVAGKPDLCGSAHPAFRGDAGYHDPEDLLLAAASACHMLAYLALCARAGVHVVAYEDRPEGILTLEPGGGGRFTDILLRPVVTVADPAHTDRAADLHHAAHRSCFIANSCSVPIRHHPLIRTLDSICGKETTDAGSGDRPG